MFNCFWIYTKSGKSNLLLKQNLYKIYYVGKWTKDDLILRSIKDICNESAIKLKKYTYVTLQYYEYRFNQKFSKLLKIIITLPDNTIKLHTQLH